MVPRMKHLTLGLCVLLAVAAHATDVTLIPDVHDVTSIRELDLELRAKARDPKMTFFYAIEGIVFEAPADRKYGHEIGLEAEIPQLFTGYLAYTAFSRQMAANFKGMTDKEKRFVLSQLVLLITHVGENNLYEEVMVAAVKRDDSAIPNGKELLKLLKPIAKRYTFENPKDYERWIENNQQTLEDNASGLTVMMILGANYVLKKTVDLDKKLGSKIDFKKAVSLMNGQLNEEETSRVFDEIDGKMREPLMIQNLIAAYKEVSAKGRPLTAMAGGGHIKPMALALRKNTDARVVIDDDKIKAIDLTKLDKVRAQAIEKVLAELNELKK